MEWVSDYILLVFLDLDNIQCPLTSAGNTDGLGLEFLNNIPCTCRTEGTNMEQVLVKRCPKGVQQVPNWITKYQLGTEDQIQYCYGSCNL